MQYELILTGKFKKKSQVGKETRLGFETFR